MGQAYKILLGLDLLGNPVGFVSGLASGTKGLFYEPFEVLNASLMHLLYWCTH